jgi:oligopeptide/dipeptide ABC transporter ATP-binding protein
MGEATMRQGSPLLEVRGLQTEFELRGGRVIRAVDGVSFDVHPGECVGIVGESGSGKSVTARSILGLVESPGRVLGGEVRFDGQDLVSMPPKRLRSLRGREIGIVFQDPTASMDPYFTAGEHMIETVRAHLPVSKHEARERSLAALRAVGVTDAEQVLERYAVDFSPGLIQRIMIALSVVCEPKLVFADEPTTTLGVLVQDQILRELKRVQRELGTALVVITHDFGVVAELSDWIVVMYAGRIVEQGPAQEILMSPRHPYTAGLIASVPQLDRPRGQRLVTIPGSPPDLASLPAGCAFAPRCARATERSRTEVPPSDAFQAGARRAACFSPLGVDDQVSA